MIELQLFRGIDRTRRTTEDDTLGLFAGESFLRALTDKIALDFGGKTECEGKDLAGDIITKPVVVLNRQTRQPRVMQILRISMIMNKLRPSLESSEQIMRSPLRTLRRSFPRRLEDQSLVPLIVSSIQPSMVISCRPQNLRISKR